MATLHFLIGKDIRPPAQLNFTLTPFPLTPEGQTCLKISFNQKETLCEKNSKSLQPAGGAKIFKAFLEESSFKVTA